MTSPILTRLLYTALGAFLALGAVAFLSRQDATDIEAVPRLLRAGYVPARMGKPTIPDLPKGAKAVATIEGGVRYEGVEPTATEGAEASTATEPTASDNRVPVRPACDLDAIAVGVNCRAELVEAGGVYLGRTIVSAKLEFGGATRTLPETVAGHFDPVAPAVTVSPSVRQRRWDLGALAGISYGSDTRPGVELGATWRRGRLGGYAIAEWQPPTSTEPAVWRGHGGVRATW